jgi:drug/metabolite transporter (DMT)-like permease
MRVRLSDERRIQFEEWVAPHAHFEPRPITRSELKRAALVLAAAAFLLLAAFLLPHGVAVALGIVVVSVFSFVPIYVANRLGEARGRRGQWIWGVVLGWIGVLVVLLRPTKDAPSVGPDRS